MSVLLAHIVFFLVIALLVFCGYSINEKIRRRKEELIEIQNDLFATYEQMEIIRISRQRRWIANGWNPDLHRTMKESPHNWKKEGF